MIMASVLCCSGRISVYNPFDEELKATNAPGQLLFYKEKQSGSWTMKLELEEYVTRRYTLNRYTLMNLPSDFRRRCLRGKFAIPLTMSDVIKFRGPLNHSNYDLIRIARTLLKIKNARQTQFFFKASSNDLSDDSEDDEEMEQQLVDLKEKSLVIKSDGIPEGEEKVDGVNGESEDHGKHNINDEEEEENINDEEDVHETSSTSEHVEEEDNDSDKSEDCADKEESDANKEEFGFTYIDEDDLRLWNDLLGINYTDANSNSSKSSNGE